jgi:hypothetical protein
MKRKIESIRTRGLHRGLIIGAIFAVTATTAASAATVYVPTAPLYAPQPGYAPPNANGALVPSLGIVLDDKGNPLPRCRELGEGGVMVMRGTNCVP